MTGRQQSGNDGWSLSGPRNGILFNQNVAGSGVNVGSVGTNGFTLQYYMAGAQFGLTSASSTSSPIWYTDMTGNVYATASYRAPIYYDSANTNYFVQPSSRSRISTLDFGNSGYYVGAGDWGIRNTTPYGWIELGPANSGHAHIYTDRSNFYFNVNDLYTNGNWVMTENYQQSGKYHGSDGSIRAYIFYDNNNTGYYMDPNSDSNILTMNVAGAGIRFNSSAGDVVNGAPWYGIGWSTRTGWTSPRMLQVAGYYGLSLRAVTTILDIDGPDYGNGWARVSSNFIVVGQSRASIFYDTDNTGYYVDPNGTTNLSTTYVGDIYTSGWFRNQNASQGLYNQAVPNHWYADSTQYWNIGATAGVGSGIGMRIRDGYAGTIKGYFYADNSGVGILNDQGGWSVRTNYGSGYGGTLINSWTSSGDHRAPIFYDSNDTGYYVDPNGAYNTNLQGVTSYSLMRMGLTYKYNTARNDYTGDSNYWVGNKGWGTTDFNTFFMWGCGFIDSWSNPGNQPSVQVTGKQSRPCTTTTVVQDTVGR